MFCQVFWYLVASYSVISPIVSRLLPSCFSFVMKEIKIKWVGPSSRNDFRYSLATEVTLSNIFHCTVTFFFFFFLLTGQYDKLLISGQTA